jgi:hypothetical protein
MTRTCPQQLSRCEMSYRRLRGYLVLLVLIPPQLPARRQGQTLPITPLRALHQHTSDTEMLRPSQCTVVHITVALYISTMPIYKHTMLTQHQFSLYTAQCSASYIYSRHLPLTVSTLNSVYSTRSIRHVRPNGNHGHWAHRATEHRSRRSRSIPLSKPSRCHFSPPYPTKNHASSCPLVPGSLLPDSKAPERLPNHFRLLSRSCRHHPS